jgi:hypothetical protein
MLIYVAVLLAINFEIAFAQDADVKRLRAELRPVMQQQINKTYYAFLDAPPDDPRSNCEAFQELQKLKEITNNKGEIVEQLAIFVVTATSEEDTHVILAMGLLQFLELPASVPIRVLAPYLDSENEKLAWFAQMWFHNHDSNRRIHGRPPFGSVNYYDYMQYVRSRLGRNEQIPDAFVKYIYERNPGKALLVFAYANRQGVGASQLLILRKAFDARRQGRELEQHEMRQLREEKQQQEIRQDQAKEEQSEILLTEHVISNAIWLKENGFDNGFQKALPEAAAELAKLAKHDAWWARLYVVYIMRQHPELRQSDVLRELRADSNSLVSDLAKSMRD